MIEALKFRAGPLMSSDLKALAWAAARFHRTGPISIYNAWDGIALADFAARTKLPLPAVYEKRLERCIASIRESGCPKAFQVRALITVAGYHLHMTRLYIDLNYHPTPEEITFACDLLDHAKTEQRRQKAVDLIA